MAAAFEPKLFQELRARFPDMIPPEDGIITYLHRQGFIQSAIRPAMKAYRDTLLFLQQEGANESHGNEQLAGADSESPEGGNRAALGKARVGDLVEVEIAGSLVTDEPVRVRAVTEDQAWVFVDGSETGIEMENVTVVDRPDPAEANAPPTLPLDASKGKQPPTNEPPTGYRSETFDADEGEIRITWPSNLSWQSVEDMKDWLELLQRRMTRRAGGPVDEE
jgi:hypothetical protein